MNGQQWFRIIAGDPAPRQRIGKLGDTALSEAIAEIEEMPAPNDFHRAVYGMLITEVILRWRGAAGVSSGTLEEEGEMGRLGERETKN
jgi:hypothetical protein